MKNIALIAAIEGNNANLNTQKGITTIQRLFEDEAISCFKNWRTNGGWLKDIPIYTMCPTHNTISEDTQHKLRELNVTYIEEYHPITEEFTSGFINVPYVGKLMEQRLTEDILIKIDLDMNLIQPLPENLVLTHDIVCGQYDDYCAKLQRGRPTGWENPFDTGFVISKRSSGFYSLFFTHVYDIMTGKIHDPIWETVRLETGEYYLEEYVIDSLVHQKLLKLTPIQKYQIGEWYTPVSRFTDEEIANVFFWHEHLIPDPKYDKIRQHVEYFNRIRRIKK